MDENIEDHKKTVWHVSVVGCILDGRPNFTIYVEDGVSVLQVASFENAAVIEAARIAIVELSGYTGKDISEDAIDNPIRLLGTEDELERLKNAIRRDRSAAARA